MVNFFIIPFDFFEKKESQSDINSMLNNSTLRFESIYSAPKIKKLYPNHQPFQVMKCSIFEGDENKMRLKLPVKAVKTLNGVAALLSQSSETVPKRI